MRIDGAGALVTGGASGLGRAVATLLASRGAKVVVFDLTASDAATETNVRYVSGDVRSEADVTRAVDAALDLRIVVSCAGIATTQSHRPAVDAPRRTRNARPARPATSTRAIPETNRTR